MPKLALFLAPLCAVASLIVLIGQAGWLSGTPPIPTQTVNSTPAITAEELEDAVKAYRSEQSLESAAELLDAAIRLNGARAARSKRLEAFGIANQPGSGDPSVGYILDLDGAEDRLVLFDHAAYPEHAVLERELERAAADPWYEVDEGLLLRVEARVEGTRLGAFTRP